MRFSLEYDAPTAPLSSQAIFCSSNMIINSAAKTHARCDGHYGIVQRSPHLKNHLATLPRMCRATTEKTKEMARTSTTTGSL